MVAFKTIPAPVDVPGTLRTPAGKYWLLSKFQIRGNWDEHSKNLWVPTGLSGISKGVSIFLSFPFLYSLSFWYA